MAKAIPDTILAKSSGEVKSYRVYLIENDTGKRYLGLSEDVEKRVENHNEGLSKWTSKYRPWKLVWNFLPMTLSEARKLENLLKRQKGGDVLVPAFPQLALVADEVS